MYSYLRGEGYTSYGRPGVSGVLSEAERLISTVSASEALTHPKNFHPFRRIFRHIHGTLNIDKKIN